MVKLIKISIAIIILLVIVTIAVVLFSSGYHEVATQEKKALIKSGEAIRGGELTQDMITNEASVDRKEGVNVIPSDDKIDDTIQFLFAALELNDVEQFTYSFNTELILIDFQSFDDSGKKKIKDAMDQITKDGKLKEVKYKTDEDAQTIQLKLIYDDGYETKVQLTYEKARSILFENRPYFYQITSSPMEIIQQTENKEG